MSYNMLNAALDYAAKGLPVFPCKRTDKAPLVKGGFKEATTNPDQIAAWWKQWPDAMIGMPTGLASGIDILDLDLKKGKDGFAALSDWQARSPIIVRTPSGGAHAWFRSEGIIRNSADKIAAGVDTRGEGGYAIVPPSMNGTSAYRFEKGELEDIAHLPTFPPDLAGRLNTKSEGPRTPGDEPRADLLLIAKALAAIPNNDMGWDDWNRVAMATWRATGGAGFEAFDKWSQKSKKYVAEETSAKWAQFTTSPPTLIGAGSIFFMADEASPIWRDVTPERRDEIERLASLPYIQYDMRRKGVAKALGIRVDTLDQYVARVRPPSPVGVEGQGTPMSFPPTVPWHESVAGEQLIADLEAAIKKHVILSEEQGLAVALWSLHSHALEYASHSARLSIVSPAPRCGKTTLLDIISELVSKPIQTENLSLAVMFRIIELAGPTLLIDEADSFLKDNEEMRGILNSGHRRGGQYLRIVGEDLEPRAFRVFAATAIAGIGRLPTTIVDRSITISLRRRKRDEEITRLGRNRTHLTVLGRRIARWVVDNGNALADADPELPDKLGDREMDNWRPLIAIADAISAAVGKRARTAALKIAEEETDDESAAIMALADVAAIFELKKVQRLSSQTLVDELIKLEDRPWSEWKRGQPMTKTSLAKLLRPFGIHSKQLRFEPKPATTVKGYEAEPIREAKLRYVDDETKLEEGDIADEPF